MFAYGFVAFVSGVLIINIWGEPITRVAGIKLPSKLNAADWIGGTLMVTGVISLLAGVFAVLWEYLP